MQIVHIQWNKEVIDLLKKNEIWMDIGGTCIFVMLCLDQKKFELLDYSDDSSKNKRLLILYRFLFRRGMLLENSESKYLYEISKKGAQFIKDLNSAFNDEIHAEDLQPSLEKLVVPIVETEKELSWEEFAEQFVAIFPKQYRVHPKIIPIRFEKFKKVFPEYMDFNLILNATKLYIKTLQENQGYIRMANFYIWKAEAGGVVYDLANWCKNFQEKANNNTIEYNLDFLNTA